ncbi:hypothetical protein SAMN04489712_10629 [Thermomonospora echinospora]|uniref:Uncharacterized protein n=1 Tax=Thermomonospora echinospora TaxID=1992 RepID=A0A1H6AUT8_9ACTN|nr:hypothetical protein [Thermomonospora echinospora]SEG52409.1 hypothetical protein SAMN04489712_10629 [Thermomonospora echinospora]
MLTAPTGLNGSKVSFSEPPDDHVNPDTAATRHLCAGVYLDRTFRSQVLCRVYGDTRHRVAPSYGFDLIPVVDHAWRSWWLDTVHQGIVLAVLAAGFAMNRPIVVTVMCWLALIFLARMVAGAVPDVLRLKSQRLADRLPHRPWQNRRQTPIGRQLEEQKRLEHQERLLRIGSGGCLALLFVSLVAASWADNHPADGIKAALRMLLLLALSAAGTAALRQMLLNRIHHASTLRPGRLTRRQKVIDEQQAHTYVIYHRPKSEEDETWTEFDPFKRKPSIFVGSGQLVHRWLPPLVVPLLQAAGKGMRDREYDNPPFRPHELVDHLRSAMLTVSDPADPRRLRLQVRDRIFLDERDVPEKRDFLSRKVGAAWIQQVIDDPHNDAQHFLEMQVSSCGELVTTVFLRVAVRGRSLSLDFAACSLTRTPYDYRVLDLFAESGRGAVVRSVLRALWRLPEETAGVFRLIELPLILGLAVLADKDRTLRPRRKLLIGSRYSVREEKSLPWKDSRFDETAIHDEIKLVEQRLLKAAEDFLEFRGVDTSAFKKKADSIINNSGVLNMGGRMEIHHSVAGANAQVQMPAHAGTSQQSGG